MSTITQEKWQETFEMLGRSCPAQRADENSISYQKRLARIGRRYIPAHEDIARVRFDSSLPDHVVETFTEQMRAAVARNIFRVDNMAANELRAVPQPGPNGSRTTLFVGPDSFVKAMGAPARRVVRINAPAQQALYTANRAHLRGMWG